MKASDTEPMPAWRGDAGQHARMKILIVDDEPVNVALLEDMLATAGYTRVKSVGDSRATLKTCDEFAPDIVLLDLMMPHIDGFAILEALRATPDELLVPVIVLTADASERTKRRALAAGATDFLVKPFDQFEVLLRIANLLEMRRLHLHLDLQRAALEDSLLARALELRSTQVATTS